jgi:hypothetical protein
MLCDLYEDLERFGEADEVAKAALERHPNDGDMVLYHASLLTRIGALDRAGEQLGKARPVTRGASWHRRAAQISEIDRRGGEELTDYHTMVRSMTHCLVVANDSALSIARRRKRAIRLLREAVPDGAPYNDAILDPLALRCIAFVAAVRFPRLPLFVARALLLVAGWFAAREQAGDDT